MISKSAIAASRTVVENLSSDNKTLDVNGDSILQNLVEASISPGLALDLAEPAYVGVVSDELISTSTQHRGPDGIFVHDLAKDEVVTAVAATIAANLDLARNVVIPMARDTHLNYLTVLEQLEKDVIQPVSILPNVYHAIWGMPQLIGMIERFESTPKATIEFPAGMPSMNEEVIVDLMKTGIPELDMEIGAWVKDQADGKIRDVFNNVFVSRYQMPGGYINAKHKTEEGYDRNDLLALFLVAASFENNLPDGVDIDLNTLRRGMWAVRDQVGRILASELRRREMIRKNNTLVIDISEKPVGDNIYRVVSVNNDVYRKYLEEGGTPESIYGAIVYDESTTYGMLLSNKENNERRWANHHGMFIQRTGAEMFTAQKRALLNAVMKSYLQTDNEERGVSEASMSAMLKDAVEAIEPGDFKKDNGQVIVRDVVCKTIFAHTNVGRVLSAMDAVEETDPELTPREAALFATIDLLARWMADQISLININH